MEFLEPNAYQALARQLFNELSSAIRRVLPVSRIEHIGSSAIVGMLSKGDLDLFVGVEAQEFPVAIAAVESLGFGIKTESFRNESVCPFESAAYPLPVGLQLVANRSEFECFITFRDRLNADPDLRLAYNQLKRNASSLSDDEYRQLKSTFIENVLASASAPERAP